MISVSPSRTRASWGSVSMGTSRSASSEAVRTAERPSTTWTIASAPDT